MPNNDLKLIQKAPNLSVLATAMSLAITVPLAISIPQNAQADSKKPVVATKTKEASTIVDPKIRTIV